MIGAAQLAALLDELSPDDQRPVERRVFTKGLAGRTCPCCATTMTRGWIHDTALEQCPEHGIWLSKAQFVELLSQHADLYTERDRDHTKLFMFAPIPILGPLIAIPLNAVFSPWAKRRRLRKYLARTTPPLKS